MRGVVIGSLKIVDWVCKGLVCCLIYRVIINLVCYKILLLLDYWYRKVVRYIVVGWVFFFCGRYYWRVYYFLCFNGVIIVFRIFDRMLMMIINELIIIILVEMVV